MELVIFAFIIIAILFISIGIFGREKKDKDVYVNFRDYPKDKIIIKLNKKRK